MAERKQLDKSRTRGLKAASEKQKEKGYTMVSYHHLLEPSGINLADVDNSSDAYATSTKLLHPKVKSTILKLIREGNYPGVAARRSGITLHTLKNWLKWGREGKNRLYYDFWLEVQKAEADAESALVSTMKRHAEHDWRAASDFLGKRFPDNWGKKDVSTQIHKVEGEILVKDRNEFADKIIGDPETRELARKLLSRTNLKTLAEPPIINSTAITVDEEE